MANLRVMCKLLKNLNISNVKAHSIPSDRRYKNWGAQEVKSGRSWKKEELRLKSNSDLHKYVLLKERNMLLTMEEEAKAQIQLFPSPERIDKVEDSMENLESVIRERNVAYHKLETGRTGERPYKMSKNAFGLRYRHEMSEYTMPKHMNKDWYEEFRSYKHDRYTEQFLLKYREKSYVSKRRQQIRDFNHVIHLLNRFPDMDMQALKEQYPNVDIEKAKASRKYGGHFAPK
ncbi:hypothetical protein NQ315_004846 [Exocentrus adspersus]|uniref:Large ribosomal subunit protein uL29m n=1 Tax=Exocentrus adspersus TaxID=1586481 RepID=A0AAV8W3H2_9CUCU|nr:hypothetical protein NQ315_004846 [Exocentrus adspersus]